MCDDTPALILEGKRQRFVDPHALGAQAHRLRCVGAADGVALAYAELFEAWRRLASGDQASAERGLARAQAHLAGADDLSAHATCESLRADLRARDGQWEEVLRIAEATLALPEERLSVWDRFRAGSSRGIALQALERHEESLRTLYQSLAEARRHGDPVMLANALGNLGGLQSSLLNLVDAAALCDEAWALCGATEWHAVVHVVGINRMAVLSGLGRHDEALALSLAMAEREPRFVERHRDVRRCLHAMVRARCGRYDDAQAYLDAVREHVGGRGLARVEWHWIQALVHNRRGRAGKALAIVQNRLALADAGSLEAAFPVDMAQVHEQGALACEALGDPVQALAFERRAAATREAAAAQAAHARRLTLQIDQELDAARRARDAALRERERLAGLNLRLEAADAAKTRFLAAASHDLRQPVQALAMYLAALQREGDERERETLMRRMGESLCALGGLFDALLDVSRLDAGAVPVRRAPLRLDRLLRRLADEQSHRAAERGLALRLRLPVGAAIADSDEALVERCLRNLIDNAIKYTPRGGIVLRLHALRGQWRVEVRDTGIGIAEAHRQLVFQEFFQVGNPERDRAKGLGLGLAIVGRTAALLGHPVGLGSRVGRGSAFWMLLPVVAGDDAPPASEPRDAPHPRRTVILIDDDRQVRDALDALLARWGHRVLSGADAQQALAAWRAGDAPAVDGAIVDLRLREGRNGLDEIAALRAQVGAGLPALVVTGDTAPERLRLLSDAEQPWLSKPVMPMRLRSWLQSLVER